MTHLFQPQLLFKLNEWRNKLNQQSTEIHKFSSASVSKFNLSMQLRKTAQLYTHYNTTSHYKPALQFDVSKSVHHHTIQIN